MPSPAKRRRFVSAAAIALAAPKVAGAQVSGTWLNPYGGTWTNPSNWSSNPSYPDGGGTATFPSGSWNVTSVIGSSTTITLSRIVIDGPSPYSIGTSITTLSFAGPAILDVNGPLPPNWISPFGEAHTVSRISTTAGLIKNGTGALAASAFSSVSGAITVNGGMLVTGSNYPLSVSTSTLTLDGGALRCADFAVPSPLPMVIGGGGGTIIAGSSTVILSSNLTGSGTLFLSAIGVTGFQANSPSSFGGWVEAQAPMRFAVTGELNHAAGLDVADIFNLNNTAGGSTDRLPDTAPINLRGGVLSSNGNSNSPSSETAGPVTLQNGLASISLDQYSPVQLASVARQNHAVLSVGSFASALRVTGTVPALVGPGPAGTPDAGIIPWARAEGATISPVTVDPDGTFRELNSSEFITALPGGITTSNLKLTGDATISSPATVNSLTIIGGSNTTTFSGSSPLTITSGAVFVDPPSTGRTLITAPLNFGATEGILHARVLGSGSVEIGGGLSGSGGVTVAGYMSLRGSSSYTGTTTVDGKLKLLDDVIAGQPGPLGADSSPVVIDGSASSGAMTLYPAPSATIQFARDLTINTYNSTGAATLALGTLPGGAGRAVVSGNIQLNGALTLAGSGIPGADRFVISGDISGSGRLVSPSYVTLSGDNTFSGGVVMNFGSLTVGSDTALGTGTVWFNTVDIGFLSASTTVTLNNPIVITGVAHFSGSNVMTLAGPIDLDGGQRSIYADNSATTTITGEVFDGSLTKMGAGLLQMTHVRLPTLAVNAGTLKILPNGTNAGTSRVQAFTISSTTSGIKLDLTDNDLIYDYNPGGIASATGFTRTYLHGGQLITSLGDGVHTGLGYGEASVLGLSSFDGQSIDSTTVLIKFTYFGDANLDGKVDIQDLLALARHYNTTGNQVWTNGDFNYDGVVNNIDLTLLVANWQAGVGAPLGEPLDATLDNLTGSASVPEPALAALVATPLLLSARRRRKSRLFCP